MGTVTETVHSTDTLQRIFKLGVWRPVGEQRGVFYCDNGKEYQAHLEKLLLERRARMFKS
jgi:hypothetical protein